MAELEIILTAVREGRLEVDEAAALIRALMPEQHPVPYVPTIPITPTVPHPPPTVWWDDQTTGRPPWLTWYHQDS